MISKWIRRIHRWIVIPFTAGVIITVLSPPPPAAADGTLPPPSPIVSVIILCMLIFLITGLYMFFQPYVATWQRNRRKRTA